MKMLVLGAGLQGSACAYDLLQNDDVEKVTVADVRFDHIPEFLSKQAGNSKLELLALDARDSSALTVAMGEVDACMNALPYYFNLEVSKRAIDAGVHCCDLGGNTAIVVEQQKLDAEARARNVSVIPDCGLAPGMVNILAAAGISELDRTDSVKMFVGGLPQKPEPPIDYQIVYSLEGVLDYYTTPSWVIEDGEPKQVEALSEVESVRFPKPVGILEAFHTAGGLSTMATRYQGKVKTMEYKTLRYPGHADLFRAIRGLGLLDQTPIDVNGKSIIPRDAFIAAAEPHLRKPHGMDLVALRVEVSGSKNGAPRKVVYDLLDYFDADNGISAMERTTGFSLSITAQLQVQHRVNDVGVLTPDIAIPADLYIAELAKRGIRIERRFEQ
jgi:lysine 6-dehydrogenase